MMTHVGLGRERGDAVHQVLQSPGRPLDSDARAGMDVRFGHDFSRVRVHTDEAAARSAASLGTRAYAVGDHIAFARNEFAPGTPAGRELLAHELFHVATEPRTDRVNLWSKEEHHRITQGLVDAVRTSKYAPAIVHDPLFGGDQFYQIVDSSFDMDVTAKRLFVTGPKFLTKISKGEGPEHGEDGNYSKPGEKGGPSAAARAENLKLQEKYVNQSLESYKRAKGEIRRTVNGNVQLTPDVRAMFKALGNACHVAQDRGAHWEGTKGMGHDDPRAKAGRWDPDDPKLNGQGYENAKSNTRDVFKAWMWGTTIEIGYGG
jgi:hypothetical protein